MTLVGKDTSMCRILFSDSNITHIIIIRVHTFGDHDFLALKVNQFIVM